MQLKLFADPPLLKSCDLLPNTARISVMIVGYKIPSFSLYSFFVAKWQCRFSFKTQRRITQMVHLHNKAFRAFHKLYISCDVGMTRKFPLNLTKS